MSDRLRRDRKYSRWLNGDIQPVGADTGPGSDWFVQSSTGSDDNTGKSWDQALATLDAGVNKCTASVGDRIWVGTYHDEDISATSLIDVDVIGVQIIGVRKGRKLPQITNTHTDADVKLAAAGCSVENIRFVGGVDAGTGMLEISAADCAVINCEYLDETGQATDVIMTTADADRLLITGWRHYGAAADTADTSIMLNGCDDTEICDCYFYGNFDLGAIECRTAATVRTWIHDCVIWTAGSEDLCIVDTITASTGIVGPNIHCILADDAANITEAVTAATFRIVGLVDVVNADAEKAVAIDWTATVDEA